MADASILVRVLVDIAKSREDGLEWLKAERLAALTAVQSGDPEITSLAFEGANATGGQRFKTDSYLEILQLAIEELTGEGPSDVFHLDFSRRQVCT